jgi:hypothetical protein
MLFSDNLVVVLGFVFTLQDKHNIHTIFQLYHDGHQFYWWRKGFDFLIDFLVF